MRWKESLPPEDSSSATPSGRGSVPEPEAAPSHHPVTFRALAVGFLCVAFLSIAVPYSDLVMQGSNIAHNCLPIGALFLFFCLVTFVNTLLARFAPRMAFSRWELITVYSMMLVSAVIPSAGLTLYVISLIPAPFYYATDENRFQALFHKYIPSWFRLHDERAVTGFYEGLKPYEPIPWSAWVKPLSLWSLYALFFFGAYFFLSVLVRRQWIENERLTFPLVQVPLEMAGDQAVPTARNPAFRNRLMWMGFALPALLLTCNGLNRYLPAVPFFTLHGLNIGSGLADPPWDAIKETRLFLYFSVIGLTYLLTSEVSLSLWLFYILHLMQRLVMAMYGIRADAGLGQFTPTTFIRNQEAGAFIAITLYLFWSARGHFKRIFRDAFKRGRSTDDPDDPIPLRWAMIGFVGCNLLMCLWGTAAGMRFWSALLSLLIFYTVVIGLTRLVTAGGLLLVECSFVPQDVLIRSLGTAAIGDASLAIISYQQMIFMFDQRATIMPYIMNDLKLAQVMRLSPRRFALAMALSVITAMGISYIAALTLIYRHGGVTLNQWYLKNGPMWTFNKLAVTLQNPISTDWLTVFGVGVGMGIMLFLILMNRSFLWWALSPLGYLMGSTYSAEHLWFSVLVGWLCNRLVRRYGGLKLYRTLRPAFLGLVFGEFLTAGFWVIVDFLLGVKGHDLYPNE